MAGKNRSYKVGNDVYDIPENEIEGFLAQNKDAIEVSSFIVDKDTFDIPLNEVDGFLKQFPNAKSLSGSDGGTAMGKQQASTEGSQEPQAQPSQPSVESGTPDFTKAPEQQLLPIPDKRQFYQSQNKKLIDKRTQLEQERTALKKQNAYQRIPELNAQIDALNLDIQSKEKELKKELKLDRDNSLKQIESLGYELPQILLKRGEIEDKIKNYTSTEKVDNLKKLLERKKELASAQDVLQTTAGQTQESIENFNKNEAEISNSFNEIVAEINDINKEEVGKLLAEYEAITNQYNQGITQYRNQAKQVEKLSKDLYTIDNPTQSEGEFSAKQIYNSLVSGIGGVLKAPVYAEYMATAITEAILPESLYPTGKINKALAKSKLDTANEVIDKFKQYVDPEKLQRIQESPLGTPQDVFTSVAGTITQMTPALLSGSGSTAVLAAMMYDEGYTSAKESGLSDEQSMLIASVYAPLGARLEKMGLESIIGKATSKAVAKEVAVAAKEGIDITESFVTKTLNATLKNKATDLLTSTGTEAITEMLQQALLDVETKAVELYNNPEKAINEIKNTDVKKVLTDYATTGALAGLTGLTMKSGFDVAKYASSSAQKGNVDVKTLVDAGEVFLAEPNQYNVFKEQLDVEQKLGTITEQQKADLLVTMNNIITKQVAIKNVPSEAKPLAYNLVSEKQDIEAQIEGSDPATTTQQQNRIQEIDSALQAATTNEPVRVKYKQQIGNKFGFEVTPDGKVTTLTEPQFKGEEAVPVKEKDTKVEEVAVREAGEEVKDYIQKLSGETSIDIAVGDVLSKVNNAEYINENKINEAIDKLYNEADKIDNSDYSQKTKDTINNEILSIIDQLENYEFTTETKTRTITEKRPTRVAIESKREQTKTNQERVVGRKVYRVDGNDFFATIDSPQKREADKSQIKGKGEEVSVIEIDEQGNITLQDYDKKGQKTTANKLSTKSINDFELVETIKDDSDVVVGAVLRSKTNIGEAFAIYDQELAYDFAVEQIKAELGEITTEEFVVATEQYEQLKKLKENAVQKQTTNEGVFRQERPEVELQEVERRDSKQEKPTEQKEEKEVKPLTEKQKFRNKLKEVKADFETKLQATKDKLKTIRDFQKQVAGIIKAYVPKSIKMLPKSLTPEAANITTAKKLDNFIQRVEAYVERVEKKALRDEIRSKFKKIASDLADTTNIRPIVEKLLGINLSAINDMQTLLNLKEIVDSIPANRLKTIDPKELESIINKTAQKETKPIEPKTIAEKVAAIDSKEGYAKLKAIQKLRDELDTLEGDDKLDDEALSKITTKLDEQEATVNEDLASEVKDLNKSTEEFIKDYEKTNNGYNQKQKEEINSFLKSLKENPPATYSVADRVNTIMQNVAMGYIPVKQMYKLGIELGTSATARPITKKIDQRKEVNWIEKWLAPFRREGVLVKGKLSLKEQVKFILGTKTFDQFDNLFGTGKDKPFQTEIFSPMTRAADKVFKEIDNELKTLYGILYPSFKSKPTREEVNKILIARQQAAWEVDDNQSSDYFWEMYKAGGKTDAERMTALENVYGVVNAKELLKSYEALKDKDGKLIDAKEYLSNLKGSEKAFNDYLTELATKNQDLLEIVAQREGKKYVRRTPEYYYTKINIGREATTNTDINNISDMVTAATTMSKTGVSLKTGLIEERTASVNYMSFNPDTIVTKQVKGAMTSYYLKDAVTRGILTLGKIQKNTTNTSAREILSGLPDTVKERLERDFVTQKTNEYERFIKTSLNKLHGAARATYLINLANRAGEFSSEAIRALRKLKLADANFEVKLVEKLLMLTNSEHTNKVFLEALPDGISRSTTAKQSLLGKIGTKGQGVVDFATSAPSLLFFTPLWASNFNNRYKAQTGTDFSYKEFKADPEGYYKKNKEAIDKAAAAADAEVTTVQGGKSRLSRATLQPYILTPLMQLVGSKKLRYLEEGSIAAKVNGLFSRFANLDFNNLSTDFKAMVWGENRSRAAGTLGALATISSAVIFNMTKDVIKNALSGDDDDDKEKKDPLSLDSAWDNLLNSAAFLATGKYGVSMRVAMSSVAGIYSQTIEDKKERKEFAKMLYSKYQIYPKDPNRLSMYDGMDIIVPFTGEMTKMLAGWAETGMTYSEMDDDQRQDAMAVSFMLDAFKTLMLIRGTGLPFVQKELNELGKAVDKMRLGKKLSDWDVKLLQKYEAVPFINDLIDE